jgi:hypothetical protein
MRKILLLVVVVAGLSLVSCGSGSSGLCAQIGKTVCQKACACKEGPGCAISLGEGFSETFDSESDCRFFLVTLSCSDGDMAAYNDAAACLPLVQAAGCTGTGEEGAFMSPPDTDVCDTPPQP